MSDVPSREHYVLQMQDVPVTWSKPTTQDRQHKPRHFIFLTKKN